MIGGGGRVFLQVMSLGSLISLITGRKMGILMHRQNKGLDLVEELFESGEVKPVIDKRFPLPEVPEALRYFGEGLARGKVVIVVKHPIDQEETH
jgi:NADPH:quinone reductase-like Zn-dependent oxidoreductase